MHFKKFEEFVIETLTTGNDFSDMDQSDNEYIIQKQERKRREDIKIQKFYDVLEYLSTNPDLPRKQILEVLRVLEKSAYELPKQLQIILSK